MGALTRLILVVPAAALCAALAGAAGAQTTPAQGPLEVHASGPATVQFGDRTTLHIVVLVDPDVVDAGTVHISAPVAPLTQLAPAEVTRFGRGPLAGTA